MSLAMRFVMRRAPLVAVLSLSSLCSLSLVAATAGAEGPAAPTAVVAVVTASRPDPAAKPAAELAPDPAALAAAAAKAEARARALAALKREFAAFGMLALLAKPPGGVPTAGTSVWSREAPPERAKVAEALWKGDVDDGPIELSRHDDDDADLVPVTTVGTVGRGSGLEDVDAFDHGQARLPPIFKTHLPVRRMDSIAKLGHRVPPDAIQRIVHSHYGAFHVCYGGGLRKNPTLGGRVVVQFTIGGDGVVSQAWDSGSNLGDADVVACVVRGFLNLPFPATEGAKITVLYALSFTPPR